MSILYQPPATDPNWSTYDKDPRFVVLAIVFESRGGLHVTAHATRDLAATWVAKQPGENRTVRAALVQTEAAH